ncbi:hypothetical protein ACSBR2_021806 [Camellia fascicularis]
MDVFDEFYTLNGSDFQNGIRSGPHGPTSTVQSDCGLDQSQTLNPSNSLTCSPLSSIRILIPSQSKSQSLSHLTIFSDCKGLSDDDDDAGRKNLGLRAQNLHLKIVASMESEKEFQELNRNLYAEIEPYSSGFLKVSDIHTIYWEQSGNPNGHPVLFLHGGPGGGTSPSNRKFFDPNFYRIILFDQRGAGKSTPHACLEENTTWDLVEDIEKLRKHLEIPEWQGSTLALAYSQSHSDKVTGIVLRGIFLLRKKELDWFYEGGAAAIYLMVVLFVMYLFDVLPCLTLIVLEDDFSFLRWLNVCVFYSQYTAWESFRDLIPENEKESFIDAYWKRLSSVDLETQYAAARAWTKWELMTARLLPNEDNIKKGDDDKFSLGLKTITFVNKGFFASDSFLLDNVEKIRHINTVIVQGRYDVCCPMMSAWDLHKAWPEAELKFIYDENYKVQYGIVVTPEIFEVHRDFDYLEKMEIIRRITNDELFICVIVQTIKFGPLVVYPSFHIQIKDLAK